LIAVDGPAGAGKSTFAGRLARFLDGAQVIHADDFASWDNQFEWWPRLLDQVISPLRAGSPGRFQRYDWVQRDFAEWHDVRPQPAIIIEGVGSARRQFTTSLAFAIWVEIAADVRLRRGIERDGEALRPFWEQWIDGERAHYARDCTRARADLIVDGNPARPPANPDAEYVRIRPFDAAG